MSERLAHPPRERISAGKPRATRTATRLAGERIEVRRHDLLRDPLPEAAFDLVHARNLLMHLPGRLDALRRLLAAAQARGLRA
jgi:chemotaxis methyl-accepting protein methylase